MILRAFKLFATCICSAYCAILFVDGYTTGGLLLSMLTVGFAYMYVDEHNEKEPRQ